MRRGKRREKEAGRAQPWEDHEKQNSESGKKKSRQNWYES
jgi:hypothetical protein